MEDFRQFSSKSTLLGKGKPLTRPCNAVFKAMFFNRGFCLSDSVSSYIHQGVAKY